jgi:hypothetical protein
MVTKIQVMVFTLKVEAVGSSKTPISYPITAHSHNSEDHDLTCFMIYILCTVLFSCHIFSFTPFSDVVAVHLLLQERVFSPYNLREHCKC